jgi:hypothetical protein
MKLLRLFAIFAAVLIFGARSTAVAQETAPGFDKAVIEALHSQVFCDEDYTADPSFFAKAVAQAEALLTYFENKYTKEQLRKGVIEVAQGKQPFGEEDTELFKNLNFLDSCMYNQKGKMDEATKEAYVKFLEHDEAVRGL